MQYKLPDWEDLEQLRNCIGFYGRESSIGPVPFQEADPLGAAIVPRITQDTQALCEYQMKHLGVQAALLTAPQDRIIAWNHLTVSMQILLARTIILRALSLLMKSSNDASNLIKHLTTLGLFDMSKIMKLMTLTAMSRVEVQSLQDQIEYGNLSLSSSSLNKDFLQLVTQVPLPLKCCLNNLSIAITALPENDAESSKLVVDMCVKDLTMLAEGLFVSRSRFAVTQSLVNILASHGGSRLMDNRADEVPLSPVQGN